MTRKSSSITIRDVAQKAGVSVATVSRYINRSAAVSSEVAQRLEQVMAELKYVPHAAARNLATRKTRVTGLVVTNIDSVFFAPLLSGIEAVVREKGYNLLVATSQDEDRPDVTQTIGTHNTDGILVFADSLTDEDIVSLHAKGFPIALIHRTPPDSLAIPSVTIENKAATRELVSHLIEVHQKRHIILLRGQTPQEDSYWREIGYREALEAHGLSYDPDLVLEGEFNQDVAYQSVTDFLVKAAHPFDAVFSSDDDMAIGAITALSEHGYRVPEDIAVVGFDDIRLAAYLNPPLTTVRAPTEEVGRVAAQQLFKRIEKRPAELLTLLPTEIILRRSCGCHMN